MKATSITQPDKATPKSLSIHIIPTAFNPHTSAVSRPLQQTSIPTQPRDPKSDGSASCKPQRDHYHSTRLLYGRSVIRLMSALAPFRMASAICFMCKGEEEGRCKTTGKKRITPTTRPQIPICHPSQLLPYPNHLLILERSLQIFLKSSRSNSFLALEYPSETAEMDSRADAYDICLFGVVGMSS